MSPGPLPLFASARGLAGFHAERARFYSAAAQVLKAAPSRGALAQARFRLYDGAADDSRVHRSTTELDAALKDLDGLDPAADFAAIRDDVSMRCQEEASVVRVRLCLAAGIEADDACITEISALSVLAERTAQALGAGSVAAAAVTSDVQAQFLRHHAAACLSLLAKRLEAGPSRLYSRLGRALAWRIEDDLALLGAPDVGA